MINLNTQIVDPTVFSILFERSAGSFNNNTAYHDCCEFLTSSAGQEAFTPVTTSVAMEVVSSSANDASAGTGTRTVSVIYLDADGYWSRTVVTMNGTTPVPLTGISASAIISMYATTGGTLLGSAGAITLRNVTTPTIIYEQIPVNTNRSQSGRFTVPRGYYAIFDNLHISAQGQPIEVKVRVTRDPFNGSTIDRYGSVTGMKLASGTTTDFPLKGIRLDAGQSLKISGITDATAGNPRIHGSIDLELIKI